MIDILHAPLPYETLLPERQPGNIDLVVIHCTELPDLAMAREYGERVLYDSGAGNSGHYYIDRDGSVLCYVDPLRVAHHTRGYNPRSIGIELVNTGRYPDWFHSARQTMTEPYPEKQIDALRALLDHLVERFPSLRHIAGHEDLDTATVPASDDPENEVPRKRDPGPQFPWARAYDPSRLGRLGT
ncbi:MULTISPECIES: N-acetylmuramoyl-L-alanine amidase [Luteibacter]|uniref:N-acetylmuramoyl-L-alanine amidase n=1 Tax=Luteibacter flocculans TaxID=2780091 RepID=A0ABY4T8K5_9GAMM|nr:MULTISPECIES: N-acetylmuramoyl-L-alanine amidase [Luteibacter]URL59670.1 N-acetylmuramoyl-L-alanine amidase [Luteibacter flocculans]SFW63880.1 N-acetylmuramoyl-L-alanine amidase [Luteibacter sp. UNCMF366Tsu5.1]